MIKHNLPTYPILDEMLLGHRELQEYQWLIDHGCFVYYQSTIEKKAENLYQLYWEGYGSTGLQVLEEANNLQNIIEATKKRKMPIRYYHWWSSQEEHTS